MAALVTREAFARLRRVRFKVLDIIPSGGARSMRAWAVLTPKS